MFRKLAVKNFKIVKFQSLTSFKFSDFVNSNNSHPFYFIRKNSWKLADTNPIKENFNSEKEKLLQAIDESKRNFMEESYFGKVGVEIEHLDNEEEKNFIYQTYETIKENKSNSELLSISNSELVNSLKLLGGCEKFEDFLNKKFPTFKRYSGEGINSLIPLVNCILSMYCHKENPVEDVILSMGHRGRLNILAMILDFPVRNLLHKINNNSDLPIDIPGICDIVTHIAGSKKKNFMAGNLNSKEITFSMIHNPSHLEMNYPIALGKTVAKRNDYSSNFSNNSAVDIEKVANICLHGDAAVSGQGVIYETLSMSNKMTYTGTIHIITNNQLGFTTEKPWTKPSDIFKGFDIPILHVNSNSMKDILAVAKVASYYQKKYKKDIVINLIGWRKYGHNEVDEPSFTQPLMYKAIRSKKKYYDELKDQLIASKIISEDNVKKSENLFENHLEKEFELSKNLVLSTKDLKNEKYPGSKSLTGKWTDLTFPHLSKFSKNGNTSINREELIQIIKDSVSLPKNFNVHQRLSNFYIKSRLEGIEKNEIDWPTAEAIAFGSLLKEGFNVRISGQDSMRGTFSQRHAGLVDQISGKIEIPFEKYFRFNGKTNEGRFEVNNSILSELGVMLYDYGFSLENSKNLVLWEAQFGDFSNCAQVVFDQFISTAEAKWLRYSAFTVLLPHGFDGAGPEHSTSRVERILQLVTHQGHSDGVPDCRNINFQVVFPTTSANYFHFIRRQMKRDYRKPLVVITPKIGLRHELYNSKIEDFEGEYKPIITSGSEQSTICVFTSGQSFINLQNFKNCSLVRIEELAPFPIKEIEQYLIKLKNLKKVVFFQEESLNAGTFYYCLPYLQKILGNSIKIEYVGRPAQEAANGCVNYHKQELKDIQEKLSKTLLI